VTYEKTYCFFAINVIIYPTPVPGFTVQPVCLGNTSLFINTTQPLNGYVINYLWSFGDNSANSTTYQPAHIYSSAGIYNVSLTATVDGTPCTATVNGQAQVYQNPQVINQIIHN
jgi:PKD repeat protein